MRRKPLGSVRDEGEIPIRLLSDIDSLFMICRGLTPPRSLSSMTFLEPSPSCTSPKMAGGRPKLERHPLSALSKSHYHPLHRSYSNQFHSSSLYAPLLDGSSTPVLSEEIPVLSLDDVGEEGGVSNVNSGILEKDLQANGQFGVVLVHGFGGGVFSWRHVMGVLSRQVGCMVAAFDRPGWGLTSRPRREDWEEKELPNPYKLDTQVVACYYSFLFLIIILISYPMG
jgi:hypothetical protein